MEAQTCECCSHAKLLEVQARALEVSWGELDAFGEEHQRARQQKRQYSDHREEIYVIHNILVTGKEFLAEDVPRLVGQIGRHGAPKPGPVERNFGE